MRRRTLAALDREVSVLALGGANFETYTQAAILCDAFYEAGGNVLDSAWLYGHGTCDRLLGDWMASRGVRDDIVLIGKGAHSPLCYPDVIARQLTESLDRLKTDVIDVYFMHRDNPDVPVGEFVDAMDAEVRAGRIRIYGGSNWTRERMDAAFAYAEKNGRHLPAALSNNFSLAEMVNPVWAGVLASSDDAWKAWLRERQIPNFAWSSQARGFFTDRAGRDKRDDRELVDAWYSERNFGRRDRALELAQAARQEPAPCGAGLLSLPGLSGDPADRPAGARRTRGFASGPRHHAHAGRGAVAGGGVAQSRRPATIAASASSFAFASGVASRALRLVARVTLVPPFRT